MQHADLMHLSSTVFTFNKPGKEGHIFAFFSVLFFAKSSKEESLKMNESQIKGYCADSTHGSGSNMSFFFFSNCSFDIILHETRDKEKFMLAPVFEPLFFFLKNKAERKQPNELR